MHFCTQNTQMKSNQSSCERLLLKQVIVGRQFAGIWGLRIRKAPPHRCPLARVLIWSVSRAWLTSSSSQAAVLRRVVSLGRIVAAFGANVAASEPHGSAAASGPANVSPQAAARTFAERPHLSEQRKPTEAVFCRATPETAPPAVSWAGKATAGARASYSSGWGPCTATYQSCHRRCWHWRAGPCRRSSQARLRGQAPRA